MFTAVVYQEMCKDMQQKYTRIAVIEAEVISENITLDLLAMTQQLITIFQPSVPQRCDIVLMTL